MNLQEAWDKIESLRGIEILEFSSSLNEEQIKYIRLKSDLRVAEWHMEWMQKPNSIFARYSVREQKKQLDMQNDKIIKYRNQIEELESQQHLAQC